MSARDMTEEGLDSQVSNSSILSTTIKMEMAIIRKVTRTRQMVALARWIKTKEETQDILMADDITTARGDGVIQ